MVALKVTEQDKKLAKQQIKAFEKIDAGKWRYANVEAWRGFIYEMVTGKWFKDNFDVSKSVKGLDDSGIVDDYDMIINAKKVEIKSATKNYFIYLMPKMHDVIDKPKDIYIGVKYNETTEPNQIQILGCITHSEILHYPIKQNKGVLYYETPLSKLPPINQKTFN